MGASVATSSGKTGPHHLTSLAVAPRSEGARFSAFGITDRHWTRDSVDEGEALELEAHFLRERIALLKEAHPGESSLLNSPLGVAFSGGGVRAAAFHCGLLWALASEGLMKDIYHLAAVSGGGYTAASLVTHMLKASKTTASAASLSSWYREVVAQTILRMQHNINYTVGHPDRFCSPSGTSGEEVGSSCLPHMCHLPALILTLGGTMLLTPTLIAVNVVWPIVLCIEHTVGGILRSTWCDPVRTNEKRTDLSQWFSDRVLFGIVTMVSGAVLLALFQALGMCKPNPPNFLRFLCRRSAQQVLVRGVVCYAIFILLPLILLQMQDGSFFSVSSDALGNPWTSYHCARYVNDSLSGVLLESCSDIRDSSNRAWYYDGDNSLYLNKTWVASHAARPTGIDTDIKLQGLTSAFLALNAILIAAGLVGLLFGLSLLRWFLTIAGPLWGAFLVAQVAQWRVFGPVTGQALLPGGLMLYSRDTSDLVFHLCTVGAVVTLPIYDILLKLTHFYYRRSLQVAFFCGGEDVDFASVARCPYCPNLLLGACVNDYRKPQEERLLCDFTLSPLFLGCQRTGFFPTDQQHRLGYMMAISGAAPDTFMLTKLDVLPIRYFLSVLSLRFGDFVRLEPDGSVAMQFGSVVRRLGEVPSFGTAVSERRGLTTQHCCQHALDRALVALPFIVCHMLLLVGQELASEADCTSYNVVIQIGLAGFVGILALSFFGFIPHLRWLMRSPLILQFQMMAMHRHQATKPPPYLYLSDGGLIECLGVLMLLRRRVPLIICSDACEDADITLRALHDTILLACEERICSFYDPSEPRRDVKMMMSELKESRDSHIRLGILYEGHNGDAPSTGELLYIRMRLLSGDCALVRPLLTEQELTQGPKKPPGSAFVDPEDLPRKASSAGIRSDASLGAQPTAPSIEQNGYAQLLVDPNSEDGSVMLRKDMNGVCCTKCCARRRGCPGRRFPHFGTGNQCLQPEHFANLCALGAEMSLPAVRRAANLIRPPRSETAAHSWG